MGIESPLTMGMVFDGVMQYLHDAGYTSETSKPYKTALNRMQKYMGSSMTPYSPETIEQLMKDLSQQLLLGKISQRTFCTTRRAAFVANEFFETGKIVSGNKEVPLTSKFCISYGSEQNVEQFLQSLKNRNYSDSTISANRHDARLFMFYLESIGSEDTKSLDNKTVAEFIPFASEFRKASIGNTLINVRHFLDFLSDHGKTKELVSEALHVNIARPKKIQFGFSNDEVSKMLNAIDTTTDLGKRDYAILLLAARSGLRAVDIRQLRLNDIKWERSEIHVVQSKTQVPLILPLMDDVGDAISDYILNVRPKLKDKPIFLTVRHPYNGLRYLNNVVEKYARISGVSETTKAPLTIHSFRRGLGVSMLKADVPLSGIIEVLGQSKKGSAKKYLALEEENLRVCATPMKAFAPKEESTI